MVTERFPIQLLFRIKHWVGQYVITMDIMRVGFPSLVQAYSRYTAIKLLLFLPLPLAIKQGGYEYHSGTDRRTWNFPIAFPHACLSAMNTLMRDGASGDGNNDTVYNLSKTSLNYRSDNRCGSYRIAIGY